MNKLKYAVSGLFFLILFPLSMPVFAQPATLADCQTIQDRQARFDCYDRWDAATGVVRESVPATPAPQQRAQVPAPPQDQPSLFSRIFHRDADVEPAPAPVATTSPPPEHFGDAQSDARIATSNEEGGELIDKVATLDQSAPYVWVITLEGGQTWQQLSSKRYNLEKGDEVRIYPTRWGRNYRLSSEKAGGYIQVKRVH